MLFKLGTAMELTIEIKILKITCYGGYSKLVLARNGGKEQSFTSCRSFYHVQIIQTFSAFN